MGVGENAMKFDATEPSRNNFNFNAGDQIVNFALRHDMEVRGHTLAWHSQTSQWVHNGNYSKEEMLAILKNHIFKVVGHWKGKITEWDVVNEVMAENQGRGVGQGYQLRGKASGQESVWYDRCGEEFIDSAFVWAHQADPDAILYINDYNIGHWDNHYESGKTHAIYNLAKRLKEDGIPIHGVGMQMHTSVEGLNVASIERTVKEFERKLEVNGVGYRAQKQGNKLVMNLGYSHNVEMEEPAGITVEVPSNTELVIKGIDKCKVGEFAANVRKIRQPEPYKGKGIRYKDEVVRRKEGKKASK